MVLSVLCRRLDRSVRARLQIICFITVVAVLVINHGWVHLTMSPDKHMKGLQNAIRSSMRHYERKLHSNSPTSTVSDRESQCGNIHEDVTNEYTIGSQPTVGKESLLQEALSRHVFNCSNIRELKIGPLLGKGHFKSTYLGSFRGMDVAIKVPNENFGSFRSCVEKILVPAQNAHSIGVLRSTLFSSCRPWKMSVFVHEIINHAVLNFPGIVNHLGYCVQDNINQSDDDVLSRGLVSVFEYGSPLHMPELRSLPFVERLRHCMDIAMLLCQLETSILGPVAYTDFHQRHFKIVDGKITIIDLDDWATSVETKCGPLDSIPAHKRAEKRIVGAYRFNCSYGVPCVMGECKGGNSKQNIHSFTNLFFQSLMNKKKIPAEVYNRHEDFFMALRRYELSAADIKAGFDIILAEQLSKET